MLTVTLAWRNLFRNTRRTLLTCLLIGFSLAALILTDGVMIGMFEVLVGGITHTLAGEAQVHRRGFTDNYDVDLMIEQPAPVLDLIRKDASVAGWAPRIITGGMIASPNNVTGGLVYGVDADREPGVSRIRDAVVLGSYLSGQDREILIGKPMAGLLEVELGDRIVVTAAEAKTGEITQELFRVSGVFEFGPRELDDNIVFINLHKAQEFLSTGEGIHEIAIRFRNPDDARNRNLPLLIQLNSDPQTEALGWLDFNPEIGPMIEMMNYTTLIVGTILFFLASLGVVNSMFMSIYERIYEFGVIKAIGTRPGQIVLLVLSEAFLIAVLSCIFGLLAGYALSSWYSEHGVPMGRMDVAGIVLDGNIHTRLAIEQFTTYPVYVTLLTLVAALYPAAFAARIVPSRALQRSL